jgi:hypothetical protein
VEVKVMRRVPLLLGHVEDHALAQDPRAADDDVEVAEATEGGVHDRLAAGHRGAALRVGDRPAAKRLDLRDHGLAAALDGARPSTVTP